jgi:hypothetical protein
MRVDTVTKMVLLVIACLLAWDVFSRGIRSVHERSSVINMCLIARQIICALYQRSARWPVVRIPGHVNQRSGGM